MHQIKPILQSFADVGVISFLDIFITFQVEPMHALPLIRSKFLQEWLFNRPCDGPCTRPSMCYPFREPKPYNDI